MPTKLFQGARRVARTSTRHKRHVARSCFRARVRANSQRTLPTPGGRGRSKFGRVQAAVGRPGSNRNWSEIRAERGPTFRRNRPASQEFVQASFRDDGTTVAQAYVRHALSVRERGLRNLGRCRLTYHRIRSRIQASRPQERTSPMTRPPPTPVRNDALLDAGIPREAPRSGCQPPRTC